MKQPKFRPSVDVFRGQDPDTRSNIQWRNDMLEKFPKLETTWRERYLTPEQLKELTGSYLREK